jgi:hypothetical protein
MRTPKTAIVHIIQPLSCDPSKLASPFSAMTEIQRIARLPVAGINKEMQNC